MLRLAVVVSCGGSNLQALINQIEQKKLPNVKIEVVISSKHNAYALERAKKHGIATVVLAKKDYENIGNFEEAFIEVLEGYHVDLIVLAGCLMIIPKTIVHKYKNRIINVHPSLIPAFCGDGFYGLKVHEAVLARGVKITGATIHFVDEGIDTGPIIIQKTVMVQQDDSAETLQSRVMEQAEWEILPEAVRLISEDKLEIIKNVVKIKK